MRRLSILLASLLPLLGAACSGSSGGGGPVAVGEAGVSTTTVLTVPTGNVLAGLRLIIPAGALAAPTTITVGVGQPTDVNARSIVGPAAALGPGGLSFAVPAQLEIPFDTSNLVNFSTADVRVQARNDATGIVAELVPSRVDEVEGVATVAIDGFSTFWVTLPFLGPGFDPNPRSLASYFPLLEGDLYVFQDRTLTVEDIGPSQVGAPNALALVQRVGGLTERVYLGRASNDDLLLLGEGFPDRRPEAEELHAEPTVFVPGSGFDGATFRGNTAFTAYTPIGSGGISYGGSYSATTLLRFPATTFETPLGVFDDIAVVTRLVGWSNSLGEQGNVVLDMFLAPGIGPVGIAIDGAPPSRLVSAIIDGVPVRAPVTTSGGGR